jgi:hypothetical protein
MLTLQNLNEFKLDCSTDGEICTQVHSYHIQVAYQKLLEIKLTCKRDLKDSLLIEFKIELKILSFKLNFSNKSCRTRLLEYNRTGLTIFEFFYKFLSIFKSG